MPTRPRGCGELALKVSHQGIEVDVLHRECVVVVVVELATAFGATDPDPVWRLAAGAPLATDLDEGLDEGNRHGAIRCPVGDPGYLAVKVELLFMRRHSRVEPNTTRGSMPRFLDEDGTGCGASPPAP